MIHLISALSYNNLLVRQHNSAYPFIIHFMVHECACVYECACDHPIEEPYMLNAMDMDGAAMRWPHDNKLLMKMMMRRASKWIGMATNIDLLQRIGGFQTSSSLFMSRLYFGVSMTLECILSDPWFKIIMSDELTQKSNFYFSITISLTQFPGESKDDVIMNIGIQPT